MTEIHEKTKICGNCDKLLPMTDFHNNKSHVTGKARNCRSCLSAQVTERRRRKKAEIIAEGETNKEIVKKISAEAEELEDLDIVKEVVIDGKLKHFTSLFVAQSESGKTVLMMYLIQLLRPYYDMVILVTKNLQAEAYDLSKFDFSTNEMYLDKVIYAIRYIQRMTKNKFNVLLIIDDIKTRQKATVQELYTNGRNSNISIMTLLQYPTMCDNIMRTNCKFIFLFNQKNPELISTTTERFLMKFVKTPIEASTKVLKEIYLSDWLQKHTANYTSVVLNIKNGTINKIKAVL